MHSDVKKRRSFVALLFAAGDLRRWHHEMNERTKQNWHKVTWGFIIVGAIGLLLAIAVPSFVKARSTSSSNSCLNQLRMIDNAKAQWAKQQGKTNGTPAVVEEINQYIHRNTTPICPAGGVYTYNPVGVKPECSFTLTNKDGSVVRHGFPE